MLRGHQLAKIIEKIEAKFDKISVDNLFEAGTPRDKLPDIDYSPKWGIQVSISSTFYMRIFLTKVF